MEAPAYWKLRRLAPRALRVLARHRGASQSIAAHEAPLKAQAQAFVLAYDAALQAGPPGPAAAALAAALRAWLPILCRDVDGFDSTDFGGRPEVPDDVADEARRLVDRVRGYQDVHGAPLGYAWSCASALNAAADRTDAERRDREAADGNLAALLAKVRTSGEALEKELSAVRRTLSARLGRQHADFVKLRPQRGQQRDEDDDPSAPSAPAPVSPAAPGAAPPS
jgi:hypothetical protein